MAKFMQYARATRGETYTLKVYSRKENSPYEWEETPSLWFKGRPANQMEKKQYRLTQGVNSDTNSIYILATNLPQDLKTGDRVLFIGKDWKVASIGYYFAQNGIVNADIMSDEYLIARCPKGVVLE